MYNNYVFTDASHALPRLLSLLQSGDEHTSRAGVVKELTHIGITLREPWKRELLVPHRKPNIAAQIFETMWVLSGRDDMESLLRYLPRAIDFSDDGKRWRAGYGARLRGWMGEVDQLAYVVDTLQANPLSRQAVMSIWDPEIDTEPGKDIPCNNWLSWSSRNGYLDLHVAIRSNDAMWGWSGINAFEWSATQEIVAGILGLEVGGLHFSTTSFHMYGKHWDKAAKIVQASSSSYVPALADSPRFDPPEKSLAMFDILCRSWFHAEEAIREGRPGASILVNAFPEPMLRSWLQVLQWWWTGDRSVLQPLEGTRLALATEYSVQPQRELEATHVVVGDIQVDVKHDDGHDARVAVAEEVARVLEELGAIAVLHDGGRELLVDTVRKVFQDAGNPDDETLKVEEIGREVWVVKTSGPSEFIEQAVRLHNEKHAAYGDSWRRRGEMLGILANIARKVDRLGKGETSDETSIDTATDLMVYLAKYAAWLDGDRSDITTRANAELYEVDALFKNFGGVATIALHEESLRSNFDLLEKWVVSQDSKRVGLVQGMLKTAYGLARTLWENDQDQYRGADAQ